MKALKVIGGIVLSSIVIITACSNLTHDKKDELTSSETISEIKKPAAQQLSTAFKKYWYTGQAEITSYKLSQARYGENHSGTAVLIYVTEDFLPKVQVKADQQHPNNVPVLKLNATKKFTTGIYPYSVMQSTFYPVANNQHAIKISSSMQEWCGNMYAQINNRKDFEFIAHSYFQDQADETLQLPKTILENELWTQIRIAPETLPTGNHQIIPSLEFMRLRHVPVKAYKAILQKNTGSDLTTYTIQYPELKRSINITFTNSFPHTIENWQETFISGFGADAKPLTTTATKMKSIKSAYWGKNKNKDFALRDSLDLN